MISFLLPNSINHFLSVVQVLFLQDKITEGKEFKIENEILFLQIDSIYPLYVLEMLNRKDFDILPIQIIKDGILMCFGYSSGLTKAVQNGKVELVHSIPYSKSGIDLIKTKRLPLIK